MGTIPLVCTPTINNIVVTKTLLDGGGGLNVISVETFAKLQVPYKRLAPTRPFTSVTDGTTVPLGHVRLSVTFGTCQNYRTENLDFDVAHIALPYNAILGYLALAKFMAITHHAYNMVKLPGRDGTITIRGEVEDAMCSVEHTYKEVAVSHPADEDDDGHLAMVPKKRLLFSPEAAATEKTSPSAGGLGAGSTYRVGAPPN